MRNIFLFFIRETKDWINFILRNIPGKIGINLRKGAYYFYAKKLNNVSIPVGFYFDSLKRVSFGKNVTIGVFCHFYSKGGSIKIEDNVAFNNNVVINSSIGGNINIGKNSLIGPNVIFRTANHNFDDIKIPINKQDHNFGNIIIENNVWIGANSIVLGNVKICEGAIIGAGSVVNKDVDSFTIVAGVPAKIIRKRK